MAKKQNLIPALGYLRKSTKGQRSGREKQEKSIPAQKREIEELAKGKFTIGNRWYTDEGISGLKRGAKRPDFQRMLDEAESMGAEAILCDNIDRSSRATYDDVQEDARALRKTGVRYIVTASHGEYDLGHRNDIAEILKFAVAVWASHEYSRQLARRVSIARRNAALEGRRTGGPVPYGYRSDGKGGFVPGDKREIRIVQLVFDLYVNKARSYYAIANYLNAQGHPTETGGRWSPKRLRDMTSNAAYAGDYVYNRGPVSELYRMDSAGDVVDRAKVDGPGKVIVTKNTHKPLVSRALFDNAQQRREARSFKRSMCKRVYPLAHILKCGHCGSGLVGCIPDKERGTIVYRCPLNNRKGKGACLPGQQKIEQDLILPFVAETLSSELTSLRDFLASAPEDVRTPWKDRTADRERIESERDRLLADIDTAENNLLLTKDVRTRQSLDSKVAEMRDQLDEMEAALRDDSPKQTWNREELRALSEWAKDFEDKAVSLPVDKKLDKEFVEMRIALQLKDDPIADLENRRAILVDPHVFNEKLLEIGAEVVIYWDTVTWTSKKGNTVLRFPLKRGRFRLGTQKGKLPRYLSDATAGLRALPSDRRGR